MQYQLQDREWDDNGYCRPLFIHEYKKVQIIEDAIRQFCFFIKINPTQKTVKGLKRLLLDMYVRFHTTSGYGTIGVYVSNGPLTEVGSDQHKILGFTGSKLYEIISAMNNVGFIDYSSGYSFKSKGGGFKPKSTGRSSIVRGTPKLIDYLEVLGLSMDDLECYDSFPIQYTYFFTGKDQKEYKRREDISEEIATSLGLEILRQYNRLIGHCDIKVHNKRLLCFEKQSCRIFRGPEGTENGRIYGGIWQHLPSKARGYIAINGHNVVEVDVRSCHPILAYGLCGFDLTELRLTEGDPYSVEGTDSKCPYTRELLKKGMVMSFNTKSVGSASKALSDYADEAVDPVTGRYELKGMVDRYDREGLSLKHLLMKLRNKHHRISKYLNTESWKELNFYESNIAMRVINHFTSQGIPVLTIHDSFLVQLQHKEELIRVLTKAISDELRIIFKYPKSLLDTKPIDTLYGGRQAENDLEDIRLHREKSRVHIQCRSFDLI